MGRMPWSSNGTFLGQVTCGEVQTLAIYKPRRGERPLWDFPSGTLAAREVAAYVVSEALDWSIVPPTVLRDGPLGEGSVQLFIDHDPDEHYLTLSDRYADRFRYFAAFDLVVNNADRKSGHCIRSRDDHIWGIDHGLTFHASPKLRTVIWDFAGDRVPAAIRNAMAALAEGLAGDLRPSLLALIDEDEVETTRRRAARLADAAHYPEPRTDYPYPWPMV